MIAKKKFLLCLVLMLMMILTAFGNTTEIKTSLTKSVVFIHGSYGSERSMIGMIKRLDTYASNTFKSLIIHVNSKGKLVIRGTIKEGKTNLIQLVFDDNNANIKKQAKWIKTTFEKLYTMGLTKTDVVAHSMGGESITYYMEDKVTDKAAKIGNFIAIGTPFDSEGEKTLISDKSKLPKDISVLAIAGVIESEEDGDGRISLTSATYGKYIFQRENYNEVIVKGENAEHSSLRDNKEVEALVAEFLWKKEIMG